LCIALMVFSSSSATGQQKTFRSKQSIQSLMEQAINGKKAPSTQIWEKALDEMESKVLPIFAVLPKQRSDNLSPEAVRYLAYRYLLATHGLRFKGLQPCAHCTNASAPVWDSVEILKKNLPSNVEQGLVEWRTRAISLRGTAAVVLALEHFVFEEGLESKSFIQRAYKLNGFSSRSSIPAHKLREVVFSHFAMVLLDGGSFKATSQMGKKMWYRMFKETKVRLAQHVQDRNMIINVLPTTKESLVGLRKKAVAALKKDRPGLQRFSFEDVTLVIANIAQEFGSVQNKECGPIKDKLHLVDPSGAGSVPTKLFYGGGYEEWHFTEVPEYLRAVGVLDETQAELGPQVLVANYMSAPNNCVTYGPQWSMCCIPECESIFSYFESQIHGPVASPSQILAAAATLPIRTVHSGVSLLPDSPLAEALQQVAGIHAGVVPLHGRLFAQWLHYAFPSECEYPHLSGTYEALSPTEWHMKTGLAPDLLSWDSEELKMETPDDATPAFSDSTPINGVPKKGKVLSHWTLVEEMYAGPVEQVQETGLPLGFVGVAIGAGSAALGVMLMLHLASSQHNVKVQPLLQI